MASRINVLLSQRGAKLRGMSVLDEWAVRRLELAKLIAKQYPAFDAIRRCIVGNGQCDLSSLDEKGRRFANHLCEARFGSIAGGIYRKPAELLKEKFLRGVWLEELVYHAVMEAGADAAVVSQKVDWVVQQYCGESEIDVIARKGDSLLFVSCKSFRHEYEKEQASSLMAALHETDNLQDHFGRQGDAAALVVTTDLIDEARNHARYPALFGRALRLDVELISLEDARWVRLVSRFRSILDNMPRS